MLACLTAPRFKDHVAYRADNADKLAARVINHIARTDYERMRNGDRYWRDHLNELERVLAAR